MLYSFLSNVELVLEIAVLLGSLDGSGHGKETRD